MFDTPILLVIFNRPDTTRKVFAVLRKIRPRTLFIAADGPRRGVISDRKRCSEARAIVRSISWKCDVKYFFRKRNKGCGLNMIGAMTWFFKSVPEGIILEDDCVPDESFFPYCRELLRRYRHNPTIMTISGDNFQGSHKRGNASYYFSVFPSIWGWATWRRSWRLYNHSLGHVDMNLIRKYFPQQNEYEYWRKIFTWVERGPADIWDYQWVYASWKNNGLSVIPQSNLVTNIGMDANATHTRSAHRLTVQATPMTFPLRHPETIQADSRADMLTEHRYYNYKDNGILRFINQLVRKF